MDPYSWKNPLFIIPCTLVTWFPGVAADLRANLSLCADIISGKDKNVVVHYLLISFHHAKLASIQSNYHAWPNCAWFLPLHVYPLSTSAVLKHEDIFSHMLARSIKKQYTWEVHEGSVNCWCIQGLPFATLIKFHDFLSIFIMFLQLIIT